MNINRDYMKLKMNIYKNVHYFFIKISMCIKQIYNHLCICMYAYINTNIYIIAMNANIYQAVTM